MTFIVILSLDDEPDIEGVDDDDEDIFTDASEYISDGGKSKCIVVSRRNCG